jgi:hypothetical protein
MAILAGDGLPPLCLLEHIATHTHRSQCRQGAKSDHYPARAVGAKWSGAEVTGRFRTQEAASQTSSVETLNGASNNHTKLAPYSNPKKYPWAISWSKFHQKLKIS